MPKSNLASQSLAAYKKTVQFFHAKDINASYEDAGGLIEDRVSSYRD
ncbi:MAG TPA: hypothetical protein VGE63_00555 [Candidatus Paceibacterota bacterium]